MKWLLMLCMLGLASSAYAGSQVVGERPLMSMSRLSLAAGGAYEWVAAAGDTPVIRPKHEFVVGLYGAMNLTPGTNGYGRTSLVGSVQWPLDTKLLRSQIGVRITLFEGH